MTTPIIINLLGQSSLQDISNQRGLKFEKRRPSKETLLDSLSTEVADQGIKSFVSLLKNSDLEELTAHLSNKVLTSYGTNNAKHKSVLTKRLAEQMSVSGIVDYLTELKPKEKLLKEILTDRMKVEPTGKKVSELIEQINTEIQLLGLSTILSNCNTKQLQVMCKDMGLQVESTAKTILLRCILAKTNYTAADKPKIERKPRVKRETDGDIVMEEEPRKEQLQAKAVKKINWEMDDDILDDSEDFEETEEVADVEMSDVAPEDIEEDSQKSEDDEDDEEEDGGNYEGSEASPGMITRSTRARPTLIPEKKSKQKRDVKGDEEPEPEEKSKPTKKSSKNKKEKETDENEENEMPSKKSKGKKNSKGSKKSKEDDDEEDE